MAKSRQQHSILQAIKAVTKALAIESIPNPTPEQKQQIHDAKVEAANVIDNSNLVTLAEHGDDGIENQHQVDAILEQANIDPVQLRNENAVAGAIATVEQITLAQTEQNAIAGEQTRQADELQ